MVPGVPRFPAGPAIRSICYAGYLLLSVTRKADGKWQPVRLSAANQQGLPADLAALRVPVPNCFGKAVSCAKPATIPAARSFRCPVSTVRP
ncbi:MAG TPA: hypothetical protein VHA56_00265 [Mucilaginibacter sp.]|nr:hypothetical protein [Mucilaginibacter sp.]